MSEDPAPEPIRLALLIEDPALADRLAALLAGVPGLRLVGATEALSLIRSDSNGADDGLPTLVDMNVLDPHELRSAVP